MVSLILGMCCLGAVCSSATAGAAKPAPARVGGIVAIWLQSPFYDRDTVLKMPVVKGGQVTVQWAEIEPAKRKYDFAPLDAQLADYGQRSQKRSAAKLRIAGKQV